jgi:hypothetical protein
MKLPRLPWWGWLLAGLALCGLVGLAIWKFGLIGAVLLPAAGAAAVVNEVAKNAGAKPIEKNDTGRPRRPGQSAVSPTPAEGEVRARPRRNRGRR